jgi:hypothetical protein
MAACKSCSMVPKLVGGSQNESPNLADVVPQQIFIQDPWEPTVDDRSNNKTGHAHEITDRISCMSAPAR